MDGSGALDRREQLALFVAKMAELLQLMNKPPLYNREEKEWRDWKFVFTSNVSAIDVHMAEEIAVAVKMKTAIVMVDQTEDSKQRGGVLFALLVQL